MCDSQKHPACDDPFDENAMAEENIIDINADKVCVVCLSVF